MDKENTNLILDLTASSWSATIINVAAIIGGSAKSSKKRGYGPRCSELGKIEALYQLIDNVKLLLSLASDIEQYILSISMNKTTPLVNSQY